MTFINREKFAEVYETLTNSVRAHCKLTSVLVGGQPATEEGVQAFVEYQLHLTGQEAEDAVKRILREEVGDTTPETGEIKTAESYAVNVIRKDNGRPYLSDHMLKACAKQSASRVGEGNGLFLRRKGSKGDFAEAGRVRGWDNSYDAGHPQFVYLVDDAGQPVKTSFERIQGKVSGPSGSVSISHDSEIVPVGTLFSFEFRFGRTGKISEQDIVEVLSMMANVGVGSARSLERGKFEILDAEIEVTKAK
jgi:hypothetical protein